MSENAAIKKQRNEVIKQLFAMQRLHRAFCEQLIGKIGIHRGQHQMLMYLAKQEQIPSQKQIADRFGISPAAVAVMLKKLENGGYVTRTTSKADNRFNEISITDKGRQIVEISAKEFTHIDQIMFEDVTGEELDELIHVMGKISDNMRTVLNREEK